MGKVGARVANYFTYYTGDPVTRKNILNNICDGAWYVVMVGLTSSFTGVYALALGASDTMLGWLSSLPALVALLSQIPGAIITERSPRRLRVVVPFGLAFRSGYLLFAFIPFLPVQPIYRAWIFVVLLSLINFPGTVSGVAWSAMMGDVFPSNLRGRVFGDRNMLLGIVQMTFTLLAGPLLDSISYPYNYVLIFALSFSALMMSTRYLSKIIERPASEEIARKNWREQWQGVGNALKDRSFLYFTAALFIVHLGFNVSAAMWTILYVKVLFLSKTFIGLLSVVSQLVSVCSYRWWGRFADRHGHRLALFISILGFVPQPFLYNFVHSAWPLIPLTMLSGFTGGGFNMVLFNALLDTAPDERVRPSYIAFFNTIMGVTGFVAPMVGVAIYQATSMYIVFSIASALRLLGLGFMAWKVGIRNAAEAKEGAA